MLWLDLSEDVFFFSQLSQSCLCCSTIFSQVQINCPPSSN